MMKNIKKVDKMVQISFPDVVFISLVFSRFEDAPGDQSYDQEGWNP